MSAQLDLFTGQPVPEKAAKKAKPAQLEMFKQSETALFGVTANPKMDVSPGKLALIREDVRTAAEIERDTMLDAQDLTVSLYTVPRLRMGPEKEYPPASLADAIHVDKADVIAIEWHYITNVFVLRLKDGSKAPANPYRLLFIKRLFYSWPIAYEGGGYVVRAPEISPTVTHNPPQEETKTITQFNISFRNEGMTTTQYPIRPGDVLEFTPNDGKTRRLCVTRITDEWIFTYGAFVKSDFIVEANWTLAELKRMDIKVVAYVDRECLRGNKTRQMWVLGTRKIPVFTPFVPALPLLPANVPEKNG